METTTTSESICNLLAKSKLLQPDVIRDLRKRWMAEAGMNASDPARFCKWLVTNKYVTEYQAGRLLKGHTDYFFFKEYKLLDSIGQGRMAGVYKAVHRLGQVVAVKVLPPSRAKDKQAFARFYREARISLRLKHPNVVRTFQADHDGSLNYLVMEYLDGETIEEVLSRRGRLPAKEAVRLVYQALLGLQHIHEKGVVHRDLKPANMMLVPSNPASTLNATVKILDVGLGRALFDEGEVLTADGTMLGTPNYLAPEQAKSAHHADIRADIYSLGCVLFECLAGQVPFPEKNPIRLMVMHASQQPPPIPEASADLQAIVSKMMAKDPAQRFATPKEAAEVLQSYLQGLAVAYAPQAPDLEATYIEWVESQGEVELPEGVELVVVEQPASSGWRGLVKKILGR